MLLSPTEAGLLLSLCKLLVAHALSDYFFQFPQWVHDKQRRMLAATGLYWHIFVTFLAAWLVGGSWQAATLITLIHGLIDAVKLKSRRQGAVVLLLDQLAHLAVLVGVAFLYSEQLTRYNFGFTISEAFRYWVLVVAVLYLSFPINVVLSSLQQNYLRKQQWSYTQQATFSYPRARLNVLERLVIFSLFFLHAAWLVAVWSVVRLGYFVSTSRRHWRYDAFTWLFNLLISALTVWLVTYFY